MAAGKGGASWVPVRFMISLGTTVWDKLIWDLWSRKPFRAGWGWWVGEAGSDVVKYPEESVHLTQHLPREGVDWQRNEKNPAFQSAVQ